MRLTAGPGPLLGTVVAVLCTLGMSVAVRGGPVDASGGGDGGVVVDVGEGENTEPVRADGRLAAVEVQPAVIVVTATRSTPEITPTPTRTSLVHI